MTEYNLLVMGYLDPTLVEEVELLRTESRLRFRLRTAAIAACVCAALLGAGAAVIASGWVEISDIIFIPSVNRNGVGISHAEVKIAYDGTVYIPLEQFSREAQNIPKFSTYLPQYKGFDSWDAAEEFLGIELANNTMLDQAGSILRSVENKQYGIKMDDVGCCVTFSGLKESPAICVDNLCPLETKDGTAVRLIVSAFIVTQPMESGERIGGMPFNNVQVPATETYITSGGIETLIVTAESLQPEKGTVCEATFQLNGASFTLFAFYVGDDPDQIVSTMKEVLDAYS